MFTGIRRWDLVLTFVVMATMFTFEMLGVYSSKMVTLTEIIKDLMPMPLRIMVYAWLGWHFIVSDLVRQLTPRT